MRKYKFLILVGLLLVLLPVSVILINSHIGAKEHANGITDVKIVKNRSGERLLVVKHDGSFGDNISYSVRVLNNNEKLLLGERLVENDGSLGKYIVEIIFYNSGFRLSLSDEYPFKSAHEFKNIPDDIKSMYKLRFAARDDSSLIMYLGSDEPINVEKKEKVIINERKGKLEIKLN